jgi:hypothetical protein
MRVSSILGAPHKAKVGKFADYESVILRMISKNLTALLKYMF